jgi:hypothetical protein
MDISLDRSLARGEAASLAGRTYGENNFKKIKRAQSKTQKRGIRVTVKRRNATGLAATVGATASLSAVTRTHHRFASEDWSRDRALRFNRPHPRRGLKPPRMPGRPCEERGPDTSPKNLKVRLRPFVIVNDLGLT